MPAAALVAVQYVGPLRPGVLVPSLGVVVKYGQAVKVSAAVAGRAPSADGTDPGEGLLAQPTNWQPAPAADDADPE